jgi:hypothetical protein
MADSKRIAADRGPRGREARLAELGVPKGKARPRSMPVYMVPREYRALKRKADRLGVTVHRRLHDLMRLEAAT